MENASKALLIAASVLIVILLIAFGMKIFNSTSGTSEQAQGAMQATEIAMFNNKFMAYAGKKLSASQVYAVINVVLASNATNPEHQVTLRWNKGDGSPTVVWGAPGATFSFDDSKTYKISMSPDDNGYICGITIKNAE